MTDTVEPKTTEQVPTNLRLLLLVEEIARTGTPMTPAALGDALGLPRPTVHRLLHTAEAEELVQRHLDGKSYGLGRRMRRIAGNVLSSDRIRTERLAILRTLATQVGETCNIAVPGREGMVYLERVETHWPLRIQLPIGTQVPFHATASGKMYLASLRADKLERLLGALDLSSRTNRTLVTVQGLLWEITAIRKRGYATDDEEFMEGMTAIALPLVDDQKRLVSTLSIHAPKQRLDLGALEGALAELHRAKERLEALVTD